MMNRLMMPVFVVLAAACSSSSGGSSASSDGDAGSSNVLACGKGSIVGSARGTDPEGLGPIAGATITAPGCTTAVSDDRGYAEVRTDPGFLMKLDVSASGYIKEHAEFALPAGAKNGFSLTGWAFKDATKTTIFTGWDDSQGYVLVLVAAQAEGGACGSPQGITLSLKGHPEIKPVYMKDVTSADPTLTSTVGITNTQGGAVFGPLPPGTYEVDGAKIGCTIGPTASAEWQFDPSFTVEAGTITAQLLQMD